jgi:hypothetical protein
MEPGEMLEQLCALAARAGLEVRRLAPPGGDAESAPRSGACLLRGRRLVLLAPGDSLEDRISVLVEALRAWEGEWLESQWLPPALRARFSRGEREGEGPDRPDGG